MAPADIAILTYLQKHIQRAMARWAYYNNDFILETDCRVPAGDLAVQRGYGVFDFFKTVEGTPVFLDAHIDRFFRSAEAMRLPVGLSKKGLKSVLLQLIARNVLPDSGIRLTLTGGLSPDGFALASPNLIITQQELQLPTPAVFERGLRLATYAHQRQLPHVKTIDYLMAIWLQPWLAEQGANDVLYHHNNSITECPRANFFIVTEEERILTPDQHILKGITRAHVLQLAGAQAAESPVTVNDLKSVHEAFITSTTKGVLPVTAIDGHPVGNGKPGPVTRQLAAALKQQVAGLKI